MRELRREKEYKASAPQDTIHRIRGILKDCDLFTLEKHYRFLTTGVAGCRVWLGDEDVEGINAGTNGKGLTARYAAASGYGELMERLENGALFPVRQRRFALSNNGTEAPEDFRGRLQSGGADLLYQFAPDERWLTAAQCAEACGDIVAAMFGIALRDVPELLSRAMEGERMPCVPFYAANEGKTRLMPMELMWRTCGTNGMCAGNEPREALIQGISELLERYAIRLLYEENTPPPVVPPEAFADTEILKRLEAMRAEGMRYEIRDCSMKRGLPVIGLRLIRPDGTQSFHLGADPSPITALERCLTELFQGGTDDIALRYHAHGIGAKPAADAAQAEKALYYGDLIENIASGSGAWPDSVFAEGEPFAGFDHPVTKSDRDDLRFLTGLVRHMGFSLYIRDNSSLGFPAYTVYIPGVSEFDFLYDAPRFHDLAACTELARRQKTLLNLPNADDDTIRGLAETLKDLERFAITIELKPQKWFLSNTELPPLARNRHGFLAMVYGHAGLYADAAEHMEQFLASEDSADAPRRLCKAMRDGWLARSQGHSEPETLYKLTAAYGEALAQKALRYDFREERFPACFDCERCPAQIHCRFEALCRRHRVAQVQMASHAIDQQALCALFPKSHA
ncbi:MAG: YcaO-like family protein [Bacillota bacterium]